MKDLVQNVYHGDPEYMYTLVQDAVSGKSKLRQRREKGQPCKSRMSIVEHVNVIYILANFKNDS